MTAALTLYQGVVEPGWLDANGHMMDGYYAVAFGFASWNVQDHLGLDADYRARTQCTLYTAEAHIVYLRELHRGEAISVQTQVLGVDRKRIRMFHRMFAEDEGLQVATMELMLLHFDQGTGSTAPFPAGIERRLRAVADAHAALPWPAEAGRSVRAVGA